MLIPAIISVIIVTAFMFVYTYVNDLVTGYMNQYKAKKAELKKAKVKTENYIGGYIASGLFVVIMIGCAITLANILIGVFGVIIGLIIFFMIVG